MGESNKKPSANFKFLIVERKDDYYERRGWVDVHDCVMENPQSEPKFSLDENYANSPSTENHPCLTASREAFDERTVFDDLKRSWIDMLERELICEKQWVNLR